MSTQLRNGGCLTLFPAFPSPSPFPCPTALPNTDCAACVVSCYCCKTCDRFAPDCFPVRAPYVHPESVRNMVERRSGRKIKKRRKGRLGRAIIQTVRVSTNETWNRLRFTVVFPDFEMCMKVLVWMLCFNACVFLINLFLWFSPKSDAVLTLRWSGCAGIKHMLFQILSCPLTISNRGLENVQIPLFHFPCYLTTQTMTQYVLC